MKAKGFHFKWNGYNVFVITDRKNKTLRLARDILNKMLLPDGRAKELLYWLQKAEIETYFLPNGNERYKMHGINGYKFGEDGLVEELEIVYL